MKNAQVTITTESAMCGSSDELASWSSGRRMARSANPASSPAMPEFQPADEAMSNAAPSSRRSIGAIMAQAGTT